MRLFLLILIAAAFIQTSFLPVNLCLVLIIARSLIAGGRENLFLAFFSGLILGILSTINIGFWPIAFLVIAQIANLIKKLPFFANIFTVLPIAFILVLSVSFFEATIFNQHLNILLNVVETILVLPAFLFIRFWEDRFIIRPNIKLRINK